MRALEKRPVEMDRVELAVSHIEHKLRALGEREVKARKIGDWVMEELRAMDQVAYVRFSSNECYFRNCCFTKGIKQFCSIGNDAIPFLIGTWKETWYIY